MITLLCCSIGFFVPMIFVAFMYDHSNRCDFQLYAEILGANRPSVMVTGLSVAQECAFWGITVEEFNARLAAK